MSSYEVTRIANIAKTVIDPATSGHQVTTNTILTNAGDGTTNALMVLDYAHHEIHSGSHFFYASHHDLAKAGVDEHLVITPNTTKWAHMIFAVDCTAGQIHVELYEDTVTSADGTLETAVNRNRNSSKTNTTLIYEAPTVTTDGTRLFSADYGNSSKNISTGGGIRASSEIVLKQNTKYLLRITEDNVEACVVNISFDWYEHTNKTDELEMIDSLAMEDTLEMK